MEPRCSTPINSYTPRFCNVQLPDFIICLGLILENNKLLSIFEILCKLLNISEYNERKEKLAFHKTVRRHAAIFEANQSN